MLLEKNLKVAEGENSNAGQKRVMDSIINGKDISLRIASYETGIFEVVSRE